MIGVRRARLRSLPGSLLGSLSRPGRMVERNLLVYRRTAMVVISGFFEPLFYLFSMGYGVGALVGDLPLDNGQKVPYAVFVAPALLATAAMNGAIYETTNNFFEKLKYAKLYDAIISTPMAIDDVARGEIMWALLRGSLYVVGFLGVVSLLGVLGLGLISSPLGILAFPAAMLVGAAFAAAGMAATTFVRRWQDFDYIQLAIMPMFLFSATFYPISAYPPALQAVVQCTPLYRGVHMIRALTTGTPDAAVALDVAYLAAMTVICMAIASRRMNRLLMS
jgi:lipooligosaccharide transport system permease protein